MIKNPHGRILRGKPKEQHLSTVPKFCPIYISYLQLNMLQFAFNYYIWQDIL